MTKGFGIKQVKILNSTQYIKEVIDEKRKKNTNHSFWNSGS